MKPLVLVLTLAATPALADCPTGDDLATGIRIVEDDGLTSIFTRLDNGIVEQVGEYSDRYRFRALLAHGVHYLQMADLENGVVVPDAITNTAYPSPAAELPVPTTGERWDVTTVVRMWDGYMFSEQQTQVWGEPFEWAIGDCTFTAIPGEINYVSEDRTMTEGVYYLPEIALGFFHSYESDYGEPEKYTAISIEAVR